MTKLAIIKDILRRYLNNEKLTERECRIVVELVYSYSQA